MPNYLSSHNAHLFLAASAMIATGSALANPVIESNARFTVITPELIRLEYSEQGAFVDAPSLFAVGRGERFDGASIKKSGEELEINTGQMRLLYKPNGKPFSEENLEVWIQSGTEEIRWTPASKQTKNLGGTINTLDQVKGPVDLGEGILSRNGWFLLDDSKGFLLVNDWVEPRPATSGTDQYLFGYGENYEAAFQSFITIGGPVPMPRKSVLGSWYSRWWHYTTEDYKNIVEQYREHNFPLDIIVMDMEWHTGDWTGWSWNYELLPNPPALLQWFREQGLTVTLNVHPSDGVRPEESMYKDFMLTLGADSSTSETITFDAGNKEYMEAYFTHTHHPREEEGVDFWWLDWQQYPDVLSMPGLLNLSWLNKLYFDNSMRTGKRGLQFSRWGAWGDHRHPIHFSGDADTGWPMLGFEVPFTSNAGNVGAYYWSHDIGGHFGDRNEEPYTRWVQFSATTAAMRLHSGIIEYLDRRPWMWPEWATESMRRSFHLRSRLIPYVYSAVRETNQTGIPLNRPMYIQWPHETDSYYAPQQYMFGNDLLVAPIASPGYGPGRVASQLVWFPEGHWYNMLTSESFTGPEWRLVSADMNEFPLYVRGGVPVPMQPYSARPTTEPLATLELHLWPGADGEENATTLYEDDGISRGYESEDFATTYISTERNGNAITLQVDATIGEYEGQVTDRAYVIVLGGVMNPLRVTLNDEPLPAEWDEVERTAFIRIPKRSIRDGFTVNINAEKVDASYFADRALARRLEGITGTKNGNILEAIQTANAEQSPTLPGLIALAGVRPVENETHYPTVGHLRRIVRNSDSPIDENGLLLTWKRTIESPRNPAPKTYYVEVNNLHGQASYAPPLWGQAPLEFLESAIDELELTCTLNGDTLRYTLPQGDTHGLLSDWLVSDFYPFNIKGHISEQSGAPETMTQEQLKALTPKTKGWTPAAPGADGIVDLLAIHKGDNRLAYAVSTFTQDEARKGILGFRSDDGIEAWLNGKKIHTANVLRGINHNWEEIPVEFAAGENVLLLKVTQAEMGWGFMVRGRLVE